MNGSSAPTKETQRGPCPPSCKDTAEGSTCEPGSGSSDSRSVDASTLDLPVSDHGSLWFVGHPVRGVVRQPEPRRTHTAGKRDPTSELLGSDKPRGHLGHLNSPKRWRAPGGSPRHPHSCRVPSAASPGPALLRPSRLPCAQGSADPHFTDGEPRLRKAGPHGPDAPGPSVGTQPRHRRLPRATVPWLPRAQAPGSNPSSALPSRGASGSPAFRSTALLALRALVPLLWALTSTQPQQPLGTSWKPVAPPPCRSPPDPGPLVPPRGPSPQTRPLHAHSLPGNLCRGSWLRDRRPRGLPAGRPAPAFPARLGNGRMQPPTHASGDLPAAASAACCAAALTGPLTRGAAGRAGQSRAPCRSPSVAPLQVGRLQGPVPREVG